MRRLQKRVPAGLLRALTCTGGRPAGGGPSEQDAPSACGAACGVSFALLSLCMACADASHASDGDALANRDASVLHPAPDADTESVPDAGQDSADAAMPDAQPAVRGSLVDHKLWSRILPADDPFGDRPAQVDCSPGATLPEYLADEWAFGVDTAYCNYVTVEQPALRSIAVGETIKIRLWHFELSAPQPAEAHAAVLVDGIPVFDERIAIPAPGGLLSREFRIERAVEAGSPILFHLHNHGTNSWALVELSNGPDEGRSYLRLGDDKENHATK